MVAIVPAIIVVPLYAPQTNPDSRPRSEPALDLLSRAMSSVGITPAVPTQEAIPE